MTVKRSNPFRQNNDQQEPDWDQIIEDQEDLADERAESDYYLDKLP